MSNQTTTKREARTLEQYISEVDAAVEAISGMSVYDLPDVDFAGLHDSGISPRRAAVQIIKAAMEDGELEY